MQLPQGLPPFALDLISEVERRFLSDPEWLPIHNFENAFQKFHKVFKRSQCFDSLLHVEPSPVHSTLKVELLEDTGLSSKNSLSLQRPPGPPSQGVRGSTTNYPFWPDGSSGQCFYGNTEKTWQEAQSYCRSQGRDLPTIQDQARVSEIISLINSTSKTTFWIGLYRDKQNWQWSNGDDVIYYHWRPPNLFCASVNSKTEWEGRVCNEINNFMCYSGELRFSSFVNTVKLDVLE
ncbi:Helicase SKI2W [Acipenser ruthenus]|uniref:Helicase SKI2W n=1 Tax=Acipenser ruthenus TaxID=7906 RepID=A0A444V0Y8_ACIRT|nr:Helicase SKI2W [Acipenser ruthenus]